MSDEWMRSGQKYIIGWDKGSEPPVTARRAYGCDHFLYHLSYTERNEVKRIELKYDNPFILRSLPSGSPHSAHY